MNNLYKNIACALLLTISSTSLNSMSSDIFSDETIELSSEQEQQLQQAVAFIEEQIVRVIIEYMIQNQLQYAFCGGMVYEIRGEELHIYPLEELDEQKAMWVLQFDITDHVLDHLSTLDQQIG